MKTIIYLFLLLNITLLLNACGGGGGDGDSARNVSGRWQGALTKISGSCNPVPPESINITHQVNQNEDAVTLLAESGFSFIGNIVGENGFSVDGSHDSINAAECNDQTRIAYDSINDSDDLSADVVVTIQRTCSERAVCTLQYSGTASRVSNPTPAPDNQTPVPTGTIVASTGGCSEINPRTVSGIFSGNGGCGISNTEFSFQNNVVVLEPFGANGLTSFNVDSANSSLANSISTDLTIKEEAGNSCTVICSPPSTFTVRCLKEGGSSCIEKF